MNYVTKLAMLSVSVFSIVVMTAGTASAAAFLKVDIATPAEFINSRKFNVEYTTLSTSSSANVDVELFENGVSIGTDTTVKPYGDSGAFAVTVPSDGTYEYVFTANDGTSSATSATKQVVVDTKPTGAVNYGNVVRNGNTYTITVTAPTTGDVVELRLFSSASNDFTADESTQVDSASIAPGETVTLSYTAPDGRQRYHAVQAFDRAGNGSTLVGDENTTVQQGLGRTDDGVASAEAAALAAAGADVAGAATDTDGDGKVDAPGESKDVNTNAADLLGDGTTKKAENAVSASDSWIAWAIIIALIAAVVGYSQRTRLKNIFGSKK